MLKDTVEIWYLALMLRWEQKASPDRHEGLLGGKPARNTQVARMVYVLNMIATGQVDRTYKRLSQRMQRGDGKSYVSSNSDWMKEPYPLLGGWYLEGCMSLAPTGTSACVVYYWRCSRR